MENIDIGFFFAVLSIYFSQAPIYIVWIVGLGLSIFNFKKNPKIFLFVIIGLIIILINSIIFTFLNAFLPILAIRQNFNLSSKSYQIINIALHFIQVLISSTGWVFILLGIFTGIKKEK